MSDYDVVITDYMGDDPSLELELLAEAGLTAFVAPSKEPGIWLAAARSARAVLTRHARLDAEVLPSLTNCQVISRYGVGHDNIDMATAEAMGIQVRWVEDYCTEEVADHALMLLLTVTRYLPALTTSVQAGGWTPTPIPPIRRLRGLTLGLVGCGRIGQAVIARARAFGLNVAVFDPYARALPEGVSRKDTLEELLSSANIVSLHVPLTPATRHLINDRTLALLQPGSLVLNVSRGGLIDLDALVTALEAGIVAGAGLDVLPREPMEERHRILDLPNVVVTPHLAYYSESSVETAKRRSVGAIVRELANAKHVINSSAVTN